MNEPTHPDYTREHERKGVLFSARIIVDDKTIDCELANISFGGAQVHLDRKTLKPGTKAALEVDPFGTYNVEVRWCRKGDVGIKFVDEQAKVSELVMASATYA